MTIEELRNDIIVKQKKGLPFICGSVVTWALIAIVSTLDLTIDFKNILVFTCSAPLLPIAWMVGKKLNIDIFSQENPLGKLGFLFTLNQLLYLLIVVWVFNAVPEKMIMVYAMVFGAHLLPYSWLYKSNGYKVFSILIPVISLILGSLFNGTVVAITLCVIEAIFVYILYRELQPVPHE